MDHQGQEEKRSNSTDTFVREMEDDPALRDLNIKQGGTQNSDLHDHDQQNGHSRSPDGFSATETLVRDSAGLSSLGNGEGKTDQLNAVQPKKYSLSVDAPPFIPSFARQQTDGTVPAFSSAVSGHLSKISAAGESARANIQEQLKTIVSPPALIGDLDGSIGESNAPLATDLHRGDGSDNETPLDRKLNAVPTKNEGIVEDCPPSYVVPQNEEKEENLQGKEGKEKEGLSVSESVVRDTDATTVTHEVEEIVAEIHDTSSASSTPEWLDVMGNGGLMKKTVRKGTPGTRPVRASVVTVRTSAEVLNSDLEANAMLKMVEKNESLTFTVGDLEVVQGAEFAVQLMDVGEIAEVKMSPKFAYGEMGNQETGVPSDATLLYTIELLKVDPPQVLENLTAQDRVATANYKVDRGNFWYLRKEPMLALSLYQRAVSVLEAPTERYTSPEDTLLLNAAKARAYGNLSSAQVEEKIWDEGLRSVNNALRYDQNNGKLWCRKIKIFREKGEIEEAVSVCEEVLQKGALVADSFLQKAKDELSSLRKKKRQADEKEKAMYQRMLGSQSKNDSRRTSPQPDTVSSVSSVPSRDNGESVSANRTWLLLGAATAVAVFGVVVGLRYYQTHR